MSTSLLQRVTPRAQKCEVEGCGRARTNVAWSSRALGVVHCDADGHAKRAAALRDKKLAAAGRWLLASLRDAPAGSVKKKAFTILCDLTVGRPRIAVDRLNSNGPVATDWAFLDVTQIAHSSSSSSPFLEYPKVVYGPIQDGRTDKRPVWQLLASRVRRDNAEEWYRYVPIEWCVDLELLERLRATDPTFLADRPHWPSLTAEALQALEGIRVRVRDRS